MTELILFLTTGVGIFISIFLIIVSILWLFVPFKIFAMKRNSDLILEALTGKQKETWKTRVDGAIKEDVDVDKLNVGFFETISDAKDRKTNENWVEKERREAQEKMNLHEQN